MLSKTRFQSLLQLTHKKGRAATGTFLVEGWRWLEEVLALPDPPDCVLVTAAAARSPEQERVLARARIAAGEFIEVTPEQLAKLTDNVSPAGVAALVRWRPRTLADLCRDLPESGPALVVALDAVADPGNVGTIVRTADWFGASGVVFGAGSVEPANPKLVRSTMGSLFHLPVAEPASLPSALATMRAAGFTLVGAALDGDDLSVFRWPERVVLVLGNEANGMQREVATALDARVRIPAYGRAESLNAAVAAAVLMADWRRAMGNLGR